MTIPMSVATSCGSVTGPACLFFIRPVETSFQDEVTDPTAMLV